MKEDSPFPAVIDVGVTMKTVQLLMASRFEEVVRPMGLTLGQWTVLRELKRSPGASASELARAAFHTPQSFGSILQQMQADGLVERTAGRGRIVDNRLTAKGRKVADESIARLDAAVSPALERLDQTDLEELLRLAEKLIAALREPVQPAR
ncbi:MarR family winged helix-turn-helix transcriptional regulator [Streptomyces kronopolitis]|uniref:MarR family winged helix-turn-helix transcriptional regulator n=1 Tax=Streptomyces kronopolitis TaxID=1612435 RepID=UPI0036751110